jgi:nucleotide-binding universal stress UspA family protein
MNAVFGDVTVYHLIAALAAGLLIGAVCAVAYRRHRSEPARQVKRILLPFTGEAISRRALDSAIRLARAEDARLVPAFLASVPLRLSLAAPAPLQCGGALPLMDAIEQRALRYEVDVDSRIERGRTPRDALQRLLAEEEFDRVVIPASSTAGAGFSADDVAWVLEHVDTEVVVFRAAPDDEKVLAATAAARPARAA